MDPPPQRGLKEKWNDHWEGKPLQSKHQQANWAGMIFFWISSISTLYVALKFTINHLFNCAWDYEDDMHKLAAWIIFIECCINWVVCTFWRGCNNVPKDTPTPQDSIVGDWSHCTVCQNNVPPRAYHCKICNVCILKRDHHCFITGNCVGFYNQRHYTVFLFYAFIGSCYSLYLAGHYFATGHNAMGWRLIPVIALIGYFRRDWIVTKDRLCVVFILSLSLVLVVLTGYFLVLQVNVVLNGRTTSETNKNVKKYQAVSKWASFCSIFGPYGLVQFIVPLPIPISGDGMSWQRNVFSKWQ